MRSQKRDFLDIFVLYPTKIIFRTFFILGVTNLKREHIGDIGRNLMTFLITNYYDVSQKLWCWNVWSWRFIFMNFCSHDHKFSNTVWILWIYNMHETIYSYTQRDRGCSHLMCHIMCQPIYELFRPHSQHLQTPKADVYHKSHGKRRWQKMQILVQNF